jgi:release factor glutamine methyltransferase
MNYGQLARLVIEKLSPLVGTREAKGIQDYLFYSYKPLGKAKWLLIQNEEVDSDFYEKVIEDLSKLSNHVPVQYVTGKSWFCDLELNVTPDVLIPRPETEELIGHMLTSLDRTQKYEILDIGTGSGAIAIKLAKELKESRITAMDISEKALEVAGINARRHDAEIKFIRQDILVYDTSDDITNESIGNYDVIVSNPPYVKKSEMALMSANVLNYEPHLALFVNDDDPLLFYRAILKFSQHHLKSSGQVWFEINENHFNDLEQLLQYFGYKEITGYKDFNNKYRFVKGINIR